MPNKHFCIIFSVWIASIILTVVCNYLIWDSCARLERIHWQLKLLNHDINQQRKMLIDVDKPHKE